MSQRTSALYHYYCEFDAEALIRKYAVLNQTPTQGIITNFLSTKILPTVCPSILASMVNTVEAVPDPGNWHADIAEWAAALLTVEHADNHEYTIVEIGCGWGCWMNNMGVAARSKGLKVMLIGVEGDRYNINSAKDVLNLNGFKEKDYKLIHGIAAPQVGEAYFPVQDKNLGENWGAEPVFYPDSATAKRLKESGAYIKLDCIPLSTVCNGKKIDLLHIDIQGSEVDYVTGNYVDIEALTKRVLVGTHSRAIDGKIADFMFSKGWKLEMERPTIYELINGLPVTRIDGVQLWKNPQY